MVSTGDDYLDRLLGGDGYPDRSTVIIVGPPGTGKEALGYSFVTSGLVQGDFCLYVTRLAVSEVKQDLGAFRAQPSDREPFWIASEGSQVKLDIGDLISVSSKIKEVLKSSAPGGRRVRVVMDVLSSLLMLNPAETVYRFLSQLFAEIKQNHDAVIVATVEEAMHTPQTLAAMEQLFDGVVEMRLYEKGLRVFPLLRVMKMRGVLPKPDFFQIGFADGRMELKPYA